MATPAAVLLRRRAAPTPTPPPTPGPRTYTRAQLMDIQGDLAVFVPDLHPEDCGLVGWPEGVGAGWFWLNWLWRVKAPEKRALVYDAIQREGWTHFCQNVTLPDVGGGYHNFAPVTEEDRAHYAATITTILDEAEARRLIVIGSAITVGYPLAPGIDPARIKIAMNSWDDSAKLWNDLKAIAASCPDALIYLELPGPRDSVAPEPSGGDEPVVPREDNGGDWIRACQARYPNFVGVLHELGDPKDPAANVDYLLRVNGWWRDTQQVLFETDLYWRIWFARSPSEARVYNDLLRSACPWLVGYMGGCTSHPVVEAPPDQAGTRTYAGDEIAVGDITFVDGENIGAFPQTARITKLTLSPAGVNVEFTKKDGPGRWIGRLLSDDGQNFQYSIGLVLRVGGQWYAAAPIEAWYGQPAAGGEIQRQQIPNPDPSVPPGQIAQNWFNYPRFGPLQGAQPKAGDVLGLFVCSGDARNHLTGEGERSNIVKIALPPEGVTATWTWS